MPWHIAKSSRCPASKPWAVLKDSDNSVAGCHETEGAAKRQLAALYANESSLQRSEMQHKVLETKATTTDLGEFTAIAAAYSVDRMNERIVPGAFKGTIRAWKESGKNIPLHWDHSGHAQNIIGTIDPASMKETADGLEVKGKLDLEESEIAREAWRSMKANRVALSFGYLVTDDAKGEDGVRELKAVDLFEVSITPAPANPDTRFIGLKSADAELLADRNYTVERVAQMQGALPVAFPEDELEGARSGELKAVWTAKFINDLPDSSFLYVESGGSKDEEGKTTPRSLRHFPVKDANGMVDLPHLRNALARIPQSNLPQDVKDRLTSKAQTMLDNAKSVEEAAPDGSAEKPTTPATQDPLRKRSLELSLEIQSDGASKRKPPPPPPEPEPKQLPDVRDLRRRSREAMLDVLRG